MADETTRKIAEGRPPGSDRTPGGRTAGGSGRRRTFAVALAALVAAHLGLAAHFAPPGVLFGGEPVIQLDSDAPVSRTARAVEALDEGGAGWSYDVRRSAGSPTGTAWDVRSPAWTFTAWLGTRSGLPIAAAHALFLAVAHLAAPWAVFAAVLLLGLGRWTAWTAALLGVTVWYFDAHAHWSWWSGRAGWALAAFLAPLALALLLRFLRDGRARWALGAGLALALLPLVHVASLLPMVAPIAAAVAAVRPPAGRRRRIGVAVLAGIVVAANAGWVWSAWRGGGGGAIPGPSGGGLGFLATDLFGVIGPDPLVSGVLSNRTAFRWMVLAAAVAGLLTWRRAGDPRSRPFAWGVGAALGVAYLGGHVWGIRDIGTYRFVLFATAFALPPAAAAIVEAVRRFDRKALSRTAAAVLAVAAVVAVPAAARDVIYFFPEAVPDPRPPPDSPMGHLGFVDAPHRAFRHETPDPSFAAVASWVRAHVPPEERIAVQGPLLAEYLLWATDAPILGGRADRLPYVRPAFGPAGGLPGGEIPPEDLRTYLSTYAVGWVVAASGRFPAAAYGGILEPVARIPPAHEVYRTRIRPDPLAGTPGTVRASTDRIEVRGTDPDRDAVLRFHWHERLGCSPDCRILREPVAGDPSGFIRIPAPHPPSLIVENRR
jgi:hypothetical protein